MTANGRTVEDLKADGHYFAAGALAYSLGHDRNYGCHYGMRSELEHARSSFTRGFDAAAAGGL